MGAMAGSPVRLADARVDLGLVTPALAACGSRAVDAARTLERLASEAAQGRKVGAASRRQGSAFLRGLFGWPCRRDRLSHAVPKRERSLGGLPRAFADAAGDGDAAPS